jgi:hypothetical protein
MTLALILYLAVIPPLMFFAGSFIRFGMGDDPARQDAEGDGVISHSSEVAGA